MARVAQRDLGGSVHGLDAADPRRACGQHVNDEAWAQFTQLGEAVKAFSWSTRGKRKVDEASSQPTRGRCGRHNLLRPTLM